ncbi:helix-turn-helix domain-containing protein [Candidatus Shapirobacteria bacterium]|nr:helix-turn-helix domain-containing protein [Candidatus Shapirobacteria bacterium]
MSLKEVNVKWLTDKQVAGILEMHVQSLRNWRAQGVGPSYSKIGRSVRYGQTDLYEFIERRKVKGE